MNDILLLVVDSSSANQVTLENAVRVAVQQATLADACVAKQRNLDAIVRVCTRGAVACQAYNRG